MKTIQTKCQLTLFLSGKVSTDYSITEIFKEFKDIALLKNSVDFKQSKGFNLRNGVIITNDM